MDRGANVFFNVALRAWRPTAYQVACWFRQVEMKATPMVSEEMTNEARDLIFELLADGEWHSHRQILVLNRREPRDIRRWQQNPAGAHTAEGASNVKVRHNGQIKAFSCLFYVATSCAGQTVHVLWNETIVEIFTHDGEHIISYPRPASTGMYYGPRTGRRGTPVKGINQNPTAGVTGTAERTVSKGGYVGVLACKFYAGYKRHGQQVAITWNTTTLTITDATGQMIASYA